MNRQQAELLSAGYRHVLTVGAMSSFAGGSWIPSHLPCCFVGEMQRAGIIKKSDEEVSPGILLCATGFHEFFGTTREHSKDVVVGNYKTGPECAAIVKSLLSKYGYELDEHGYIIERNWAQEQYQKAINGPKLIGAAA